MYTFSEKSLSYQNQLKKFMDDYIYPNEEFYSQQLAKAQNRFSTLPLVDELKAKDTKQRKTMEIRLLIFQIKK